MTTEQYMAQFRKIRAAAAAAPKPKKKIYYFAYGSNMLRAQMKARCPLAVPCAKGILRGFEFAINDRGVATLMRNEGSLVYGVIYELTPMCEEYLDIYEGIKIGCYGKFRLAVEVLPTNHLLDCLVYIDPTKRTAAPRCGYLERVLEGAKQFRLPKKYIDEIKEWSI